MELFKTNKILFTLVFIYPIDKGVKLAWKYLITFCGLFIIGIEVVSVIGSILYVFRHSNDLTEILYVFFQITAIFGAIITFLIGIILRRKFVALIKRIQNIYDSSKRFKV